MIETMYIGSGDINALMAGKTTQSHISLMQRFVSGIKPYYNSKASPIDALRTGAILEDRYLLTLPENYFSQYVCVSNEMDVFKCSIDFAKIENGEIVDFDELKTISLSDYLENIIPIKNTNSLLIEYLKKKHKPYYNQVQEQLYCTELDECNLTFLSVLSYNDEENYNRIIKDNEFVKIRIKRDEKVINGIKERGCIFQQIKDYYTK